MRLLLVAAANSVHTRRWANALAERGLEVHLATQHDPLPSYDQRVVLHRLPHFGGLGYFLNRMQLRAMAGRVRADVVNAHYATGYGSLGAAVRDVPYVLNVWGSDVFEFPRKGPLHHRLLKRNLLRADRLVSTSEAMAKEVRSILNADVSIAIVPFGVDTGLFKPAAPRESNGPLVIGTVKTLAPTYGIDILLRAFALVPASIEGREVRLRIVGTGTQEGQLRRLNASLGIADRVDFVGAVAHDHVREELARMDVFVALSRSESFGVAVIEASACGLPVVVSDVGGLPEVVDHDLTGIVVPTEDPEAAAQAFTTLLSSPELRERLGANGRQRVERAYAWDTCVDRMIKVYHEVMQKVS